MVKHSILFPGLVVAALVCAGAARAQVFYPYPNARVVPGESPALGLTVGFGDDLTRLVGFGRFNMSSVMDLGLEFVWDNLDADGNGDDTGLYGGGVDVKYQIVPQDQEMLVDIAVQAGAGFRARSGFTGITVPIGGIVSYTIAVEGDREIVPFGGVYLVIDYVDVDSGSDTELDAEVRIGASAEIVDRAALFAALHAGNGTVFFLGFSAGL